MVALDRKFALAALAADGLVTTDAWVDIEDTMVEAISAARPHWGTDKVHDSATRLTAMIAD